MLIVDDEKHTRDGLQQALADNYDVSTAASADEAAADGGGVDCGGRAGERETEFELVAGEPAKAP